MRQRDRASTAGLLPRMEARPWSDGKTVSYRYHPIGGKPIPLGTDKAEACRKVLDMLGTHDDSGTIGRLWKQYKDSHEWRGLRERTQADYEAYAAKLLPVFEHVHAANITSPDVARYIFVERKGETRANREVSLLGNLLSLAIVRGEATHNPCRGGQVKRVKERPKTTAPDLGEVAALAAFAEQKAGQWRVIAMAAEFAALAGPRQAELLPLHWPAFGADEVRLDRAKQRKGVKKVEKVTVSPALLDLRTRLQAVARDGRVGAVFPNRQGNPYTSSGFASMWQKLIKEALAQKVVTQRFTFHDLRAHYTTRHQELLGELPNLHQSEATTARIYERSGVARRKAL